MEDFEISNSGVLSFNTSPDYQNPDDSDNDGVYRVTVRGSANNVNVNRHITITATNVNEPPIINFAFGDLTISPGRSTMISLGNRFSDPDGNSLTYTANSSAVGIATVSVIRTTLSLTAVSSGSATITVTAADRVLGNANKLKVFDEFAVEVTPSQPRALMKVEMIGGRGKTVKWNSVTGVDGCEVETTPMESDQQATVSGESAEVTGLTPGTLYCFRVRACKQQGSSCLYSPWSNGVEMNTPAPKGPGHQEDHTVAYMEGSITASLTPKVPDPVIVIRTAIEDAVDRWNAEASKIAGKNLTICKTGVRSCDSSNHVNWTITIQAAGETSPGKNESCIWSTACTKDSSFPSRSQHIAGINLIFEEPAWECRDANAMPGTCPPADNLRIYWIDVAGEDRAEAKGPAGNVIGEYRYVDPIMMHEFGHTFGLHDFYDDTTMDHLAAVMNNPYTNETPTTQNIEQLKTIYALHNSPPIHRDKSEFRCVPEEPL